MAYGNFAKIYDELILEDINYEEMCLRIMEICKEEKINFKNYLDIACGTGNVTKRLAKNFNESFAIDLSEDMLREAFEKFKKEKVKCKILCQDMTNLNLNRKFDLITCVLDSSNYIIEESKFIDYIKSVKNHLNDEGIFIFDINSYYKLSTILGNNTYTYNEEEVFYVWENNFQDDLLSMYLTFFVKENNNDLYERFEEEHLEKAYKEEFIEKTLKSLDLKIIGKFDGYSKNEVNSTTERIVYVVKK